MSLEQPRICLSERANASRSSTTRKKHRKKWPTHPLFIHLCHEYQTHLHNSKLMNSTRKLCWCPYKVKKNNCTSHVYTFSVWVTVHSFDCLLCIPKCMSLVISLKPPVTIGTSFSQLTFLCQLTHFFTNFISFRKVSLRLISDLIAFMATCNFWEADISWVLVNHACFQNMGLLYESIEVQWTIYCSVAPLVLLAHQQTADLEGRTMVNYCCICLLMSKTWIITGSSIFRSCEPTIRLANRLS